MEKGGCLATLIPVFREDAGISAFVIMSLIFLVSVVIIFAYPTFQPNR